jgi:hypothetical protein
MHRKYSNKTLDAMARFIDARFTHTEMDSVFLYASVPDSLDSGSNKLARSLSVLRQLSRSEEEAHAEILDELFNEVLRRRSKDFEPPKYSRESQDELATTLKRALKADGYDIVEGRIVSSDKLEFELASETSLLESKLQKHGMHDVVKTLDQAHQNFIEGQFEACNAMLRTSLEGTMKHIATKVAGSLANIPSSNPAYSVTPADVRKYLHQQGFFEQDEIGYIKEFYGYASTDGSHPGLSNESESRLRRLMIVALIQYCLEKLESRHP